ncbi:MULTISPECIES: hypothetical protein [unclassified Sulfuricurvum]|uniref:hypothetical protein n=1 Tax=unclassified Sulfuricurvum TaxID=2632390 RepID=UPI0002999297|nr:MULTISPECIES: hypothetical protein [unclassified Sulfuricurvum]AFV96666.1 hypothetical protein B649_01760 [Candidatus Sulfuricurvum sp. RIFRC-1]OHD86290.1 MAG: hypothetical protein A3I60_02330 [Sulfuricurvum sp. RIFCSPLOWO2_02_FULL_43_45]OHD90423.1 MAG: hypothetical protein A3G19_02800 [Sulfuricurvum sp. RIFCSPLOWO2_12_FULL_43_24]HBM36117.1 hypothetical protein [Sulfuricurvum sp.]
MKKNGITFILLSWMILFATIQTYAAEAKGYKIVLASYPTFEEAKAALDKLGSQIGTSELALQKEYRFDIAARASGKAFMLAVEPIETEKGAEFVLKQFKKYYPDAYVNGYFGPTKGAVFFKQPQPESLIEEANATDANMTTAAKELVEENATVPAPVVPVITDDNLPEDFSEPEEPKSKTGLIISLLIAGGVVLVLWRMRKQKSPQPVKEFKEKYEEAVEESESEDRVEMIESEAFSIIEEDETPQNIQPKVFEPEPDIFYKLKKNIFFMTLMGELKAASDSKDDQRCRDLMDEVLRYQKNFRTSEIITVMQNLIETKAYDELALVISRETN